MKTYDRYLVPEAACKKRLDVWLAEVSGCSRSQVQKALRDGLITGPEGCTKAHFLVVPGTTYQWTKEETSKAPAPKKMPLDIGYEDRHILVVNKPAGQLVHPIHPKDDTSLVSALMAYTELAKRKDPLRPGIVHRLDKDTSGLIVVAKTDQALQVLLEDFLHHRVERRYLALVAGHPTQEMGTIRLPIGRSPTNPLKRVVEANGGRPAVTHYKVLLYGLDYSLVMCQLETGRTHQIRVHLAALGHPLLGDHLYGTAKNPFGFQGQALHAHYLSLIHPVTKEPVTCLAPAPGIFRRAVARIETELRSERRNAIYDE